MSKNHFKVRAISATSALVIGGALVVAAAVPASAHVTVSSPSATQGGYGTITFKVPTESDTASTTKLVVTVPEDAPLASVTYEPIPGWTTTVTKVPLANPVTVGEATLTERVGSITWTANKDSGIKPGQFQTFPISAGPLPKVETVTFDAAQTYSDGEVVNWNEVEVAGGEEPAKPAPVLKLAAAGAAADAHGASHSTSDSAESTSSTSPWSIAALIASIVAIIISVIAIVGSRAKREQ